MTIFRFEDFALDTRNFQLRRGGDQVEIEPKVFDLLSYLLVNRDRLVSRAELFESLWPGQVVSDTSLSNQIKAARKAIGDSGEAQSIIKTVRGRGYQFVASVEEQGPPPGLESKVDSAAGNSVSANGLSIVVLPFSNLCGDSDKAYFCDGITEDIRTGLGRFRELLVIARGTTFQLRDNQVDPIEVAAKLGVAYLLQGSVRIDGDRVRVSVHLVDGGSGSQVWADTYDRVLDDIFAVQDDITQAIVAALGRRLEQAGREMALRKPADDLTVNDLLFRARHFFPDWHGSREEILHSREWYERALALDPDCAAASAGLAITWYAEFQAPWAEDTDLAGERSEVFARKALALDDSDSNAHLVLGLVYRDIKENVTLARKHMDLAINANPNDYWSYCSKCNLLLVTGDFEEGISCGEEAIRRNPLLPDSCLRSIGLAQYLSRRYQQAIATFEEVPSQNTIVLAYLAACHAQLDRIDEASNIASRFSTDNRAESLIENVANADSWRRFWSNIVNLKDAEMQDHLLEGLRKAGIVD